jgi:uncharacterized glyoxalase superfamily protein PhnB
MPSSFSTWHDHARRCRDGVWTVLVAAPREGQRVTQGIYVVVGDVDTHYARAKARAEIVIDIKTQDYGGRDYTAKDLDGHVWSFGTYDPWLS